MSHWHRPANSVSLARLLSRRSFILDAALSADLDSCFPDGVCISHPPQTLEWQQPNMWARLCYARHSVLLTANREFVALLNLETRQAWGVLLPA